MKQAIKRILILVLVLASLMTLFACSNEFTIVYSANGGVFEDGSTEKSITLALGKPIEKPETPTNGDLFFAGWSLDQEGGEAFDFSSNVVLKSITLYAMWSEIPPEEIPGYEEEEIYPDIPVGGEAADLLGKTPAQLYKAFLSNMSKLENFKTLVNISAEMTLLGKTESHSQQLLLETDGRNQHLCLTSDFGEEQNGEFWYVDGMLYLILGDKQNAAKLTYEEYAERFSPENIADELFMDDSLTSLPEEWFENAVFKKTEEGDFSVEFSVNGKEYMDAFKEGMLEGEVLNNASLDYKVSFGKNGILKKIEAVIFAEIETVSQKLTTSVEFSNIDSVKIALPADIKWTIVDDLFGDNNEELKPEGGNSRPEENEKPNEKPEGGNTDSDGSLKPNNPGFAEKPEDGGENPDDGNSRPGESERPWRPEEDKKPDDGSSDSGVVVRPWNPEGNDKGDYDGSKDEYENGKDEIFKDDYLGNMGDYIGGGKFEDLTSPGGSVSDGKFENGENGDGAGAGREEEKTEEEEKKEEFKKDEFTDGYISADGWL